VGQSRYCSWHFFRACKILNKKQLSNLPPEVKDDVIKRLEMIEFKKKYESMSKEERRQFMKERRKKLKGRENVSEQFEDQDLVRTGKAKLVPILYVVFI